MSPFDPYYTVECPRTVPLFTNAWNDLGGCDWPSQVRGSFPTETEACKWARDHLPHGAPFTVRLVPVFVEVAE